MSDDRGILLETGTNEFEIVEFSVGNVYYGINVAKVREVIKPVPVTKIAQAHPLMDGIFSLRGKVIPQISLSKMLNTPEKSEYRILVCEINKVHTGFKVDEVYRIHRISWEDMEQPPNVMGSDMVVGIVRIQDKLILLLDFERILADVNPEINRKLSEIPTAKEATVTSRHTKHILIAEDSKTLRELLLHTLTEAGYNVISADNGQRAWDILSDAVTDGTLEQKVQLVVTDIEMPQMDGHHLTKRIKTTDSLKHLPVIIFSSLINDEMRRKGESIGADAQITKPEISQLIGIVDSKIL